MLEEMRGRGGVVFFRRALKKLRGLPGFGYAAGLAVASRKSHLVLQRKVFDMKRLRASGGRGAFTLVELLVVIGIIGLLVSILLPTLSKAREMGKRTACLSNLRQVQQAFAIYANQYKDMVPLGYQGSGYQMNYTICVGSPSHWIMFGYLFQAKLAQNARVYFCESEQSYLYHMYNTPLNTFPPPASFEPAKNGTYRAGYGLRPGIGTGPNQDWSWTTGAPDSFFPPGHATNTKSPVTSQPMSMPHLSKLKSKAIVTDIFASEVRVLTRHNKGINVAYANGSAKWVPIKVLKEKDSAGKDPLFESNESFSSNYNGFQRTIWDRLDTQ